MLTHPPVTFWTLHHYLIHDSRAVTLQVKKINALKHTVITEAEVLLSDQDSDQASCSSKLPNPTVPKAVPKDQGEAGVAVPPTAKKKKKKTLASFFEHSTLTSTTRTQKHAVENELSSYLLSACLESNADPLKWWMNHEINFPGLSRLEKKYMCASHQLPF